MTKTVPQKEDGTTLAGGWMNMKGKKDGNMFQPETS